MLWHLKQTSYVQVCRSSLLSGRNVRWQHRMLPPGESRWVPVCAARPINVKKRWNRQTYGRTDGRPRSFTSSSRTALTDYYQLPGPFILSYRQFLEHVKNMPRRVVSYRFPLRAAGFSVPFTRWRDRVLRSHAVVSSMIIRYDTIYLRAIKSWRNGHCELWIYAKFDCLKSKIIFFN